MPVLGPIETLTPDEQAGALPMYVIYRPTTSDHPGLWVLRKWLVKHGQILAAVDHGTFERLEAARTELPSGLTNIGRQSDDDPVIEEVWI